MRKFSSVTHLCSEVSDESRASSTPFICIGMICSNYICKHKRRKHCSKSMPVLLSRPIWWHPTKQDRNLSQMRRIITPKGYAYRWLDSFIVLGLLNACQALNFVQWDMIYISHRLLTPLLKILFPCWAACWIHCTARKKYWKRNARTVFLDVWDGSLYNYQSWGRGETENRSLQQKNYYPEHFSRPTMDSLPVDTMNASQA